MATFAERCNLSSIDPQPNWGLLFHQQCPHELARLSVFFNISGHDVRQVIQLIYPHHFTPEPLVQLRAFLTSNPAYLAVSIISILAICCNVFCLMVMFRIRMALSGHRLFIISLCFSDASISFCILLHVRQQFLNVQLTNPREKDVCMENSLLSYLYSGYLLTLFNLIGMAVDHFIGILRPLYYCRWMSTRNTTLAIVAIWIIGTILGCGPYVFAFIVIFTAGDPTMQSYCSLATTSAYNYYPTILVFSTPIGFGIIFFCYWRIFQKIDDLHRRTPRLLSQTEIKKATVTTLLIVVSFAVFWVPWCLVELYQELSLRLLKVNKENFAWKELLTLGNICFVLLNMNALADPIIYTFRMAQIRSRMAHVLCIEAIRQRLRQRSGFFSHSAGLGHHNNNNNNNNNNKAQEHQLFNMKVSEPLLKPSQTVPNGLCGAPVTAILAGSAIVASVEQVGSDSMVMTPPNTLTTTPDGGTATRTQSSSTTGGLVTSTNSTRSNSSQSDHCPILNTFRESSSHLLLEHGTLKECQQEEQKQELETKNEAFIADHPIPKIKSIASNKNGVIIQNDETASSVEQILKMRTVGQNQNYDKQ